MEELADDQMVQLIIDAVRYVAQRRKHSELWALTQLLVEIPECDHTYWLPLLPRIRAQLGITHR